jgi:UDP-N-acetylglucosamine acyltransferase
VAARNDEATWVGFPLKLESTSFRCRHWGDRKSAFVIDTLQEDRVMPLTLTDLIHPSAVIDPESELAPDVRIGPYSIIEGPVRIGPGCVIEGHACLSGPLTMGCDNFVGHGAVLGKSPQHKGYKGEPTFLRIGDGNTFREQVTVHRGTVAGGGETWIGDGNLFMIGSHVGHDARVGNGCTLVNGALVAGHVVLDDGCLLSGHAAVQQRVRVGRLAMLGGLGSSTKDIPPFVLQQGYNCVTGLNIVGLRRAGVESASINALREAFRILFKEGRTLRSALDRISEDLGTLSEVNEFVTFIRQSSQGISPARNRERQRRTD